MASQLRQGDQPCIACDGTLVEDLFCVNRVRILRCPCGLARAEVSPGFDPASIYTADYFNGGHRDGYADYEHRGEELRREFRPLARALASRTGGGRLLEVGSAYGFFLDVAAEHFEVHGVEISADARSACRARGLHVSTTLSEATEGQPPFDAAVMLDVIEHLARPHELLEQVRAATRPGAPLVITTGDHSSVLARLMGRRWRLMTPPQHLFFFTPASLSALLARNGFIVERIEHPGKRVPFSLVAFQASRYLGSGMQRRVQQLVQRHALRGSLPVNLFDTMRVTARAA